MPATPAFDDLLALIEDRSAALRTCVADSPSLEVRVPSCPDWSLHDLVRHLTEVQLFWAAAVVAGPSEKAPTAEPAGEGLPDDLLSRSTAATQELIAALRSAGPGTGCWTWWADSDVPMTSGAVARHQAQEAAIHAHDAQLATGTPQHVPTVLALDGIAEFLSLSHGTADPWPYGPARIGLHAAEGESWLLDLRPPEADVPGKGSGVVADLHGSASDLLLALHGRLSPDRLRSHGDRATLDRFLSWPDLE